MKKFIVTYLNGISRMPQQEIVNALDEDDLIKRVESKLDILIPDFEKVKESIIDINDKNQILNYIRDIFKHSKKSIPINHDTFLKDAEAYNYDYFLDETEELVEEGVDLKDWNIDLFSKGIIHYLNMVMYPNINNNMEEAGFEKDFSNPMYYDSWTITNITEINIQ